jgi:hypothetical protein
MSSKIYVCECGQIYEGGRPFLVTTSLKVAWNAMKKRRIVEENQERIYPLFGRLHPVGPMHWKNDVEYYIIYVFTDGEQK